LGTGDIDKDGHFRDLLMNGVRGWIGIDKDGDFSIC